jgi:hypothetical protein
MRKVTKLSGLRSTMYLNRGGSMYFSRGPTMPTINEAESFTSKDQEGKNHRSQQHHAGNSSNPGSSSSSQQTYTRRAAAAVVQWFTLAETNTNFFLFPECHSVVCGDDTVIDTARESTFFEKNISQNGTMLEEQAEYLSDDDSSVPGLNLYE